MSDIRSDHGNGSNRNSEAAIDAVLPQIRGVLQNLRFGSVTIIVQDGVVVQIDRTEKRRIQPNVRRTANHNRVEITGIEPTVRSPGQHTSQLELAQESIR
ncbi:MAG: YezD family protein [Thermoguttaceae bacterium]